MNSTLWTIIVLVVVLVAAVGTIAALKKRDNKVKYNKRHDEYRTQREALNKAEPTGRDATQSVRERRKKRDNEQLGEYHSQRAAASRRDPYNEEYDEYVPRPPGREAAHRRDADYKRGPDNYDDFMTNPSYWLALGWYSDHDNELHHSSEPSKDSLVEIEQGTFPDVTDHIPVTETPRSDPTPSYDPPTTHHYHHDSGSSSSSYDSGSSSYDSGSSGGGYSGGSDSGSYGGGDSGSY